MEKTTAARTNRTTDSKCSWRLTNSDRGVQKPTPGPAYRISLFPFSSSLLVCLREFDENVVSLNRNGVRICFDLGVIHPRAIGQLESPCMPWARDASIVNPTRGKGGALMRAEIIHRIELPFDSKDGDHPIAHGKCPAFVFLNLGRLRNRYQVRHEIIPIARS